MLLLLVLVRLLLLLLSMLLLVLVRLLLLLSMLLLLVLIRLLLLLLSMLLLLGFGLLGLVLLLFRMVLFFALLLVLRVSRRDSEKQRQNSCAGASNKFHGRYLRGCWVRNACLLQASGRRVDGTTNGFPGNEKFHSPVLLPAGGVIVGGYRQSVAETFRAK